MPSLKIRTSQNTNVSAGTNVLEATQGACVKRWNILYMTFSVLYLFTPVLPEKQKLASLLHAASLGLQLQSLTLGATGIVSSVGRLSSISTDGDFGVALILVVFLITKVL